MQKKRCAMTLVSILAFLVVFFTVPTIAVQLLQTDCNDADLWVNEHREKLPDTLAGLLSLPSHYRMLTFSALSPVDKSRLFREHYESFLQQNPQLTDQQVALIHEVMNLATPDLYRHEDGEHPGGREADEKMFNRLADTFSRAQLIEMSLKLAPTKTNYFSLLSLRTNLRSRLVGLLDNFAFTQVAHAREGLECDCEWEFWCTLMGGKCYYGCQPGYGGCGLLFCELCTKICW